MGQRRIKFYSVNDMGTGWHLQKMEAFFQDWDILTDNPDVNTILELFNIKKFLDAGVRLVQWSDLQLEEYKEPMLMISGCYYVKTRFTSILVQRQ